MKALTNPTAVGAFLGMFLVVFALTGWTEAGSEAAEEKAWLGVQLQALNDDLKEAMDLDEDVQGVLVAGVLDGSPADKAGLEDGDVIVSFDGEDMRSVKDLISAVQDHSPGDKVEIAVMRDGQAKTITAELGKSDKKLRIRDMYIPDLSHLEGLGKKAHRWVEAWDEEQGYLGVRILDVDDDLGEYFKVKQGEGVLIVGVLEDSPAEEAGLKAGDVVLEFDGEAVKDVGTFRKYVAKSEPGEDVSIVVKRKGKKQTFEVGIGEMESPMRRFMHGFMVPPKMRSGRIVVEDDEGHIEVYGFPRWHDERCRPIGKGAYRIYLRDLEDLDEIEELEILEDREDLEEDIRKLEKEMEKLREDIEKLKK